MAQFFFFRLIPPRPTFAQDMSPEERGLMGQHAVYLREFFNAGQVLAYGPVLDAAGSYGFGVLHMESIDEAERLAQSDPTVKAGLTTYSISPMHLGGAQAPRT